MKLLAGLAIFSAALASPVGFGTISYTTLPPPTRTCLPGEEVFDYCIPTGVVASTSEPLIAERTINTARSGGFTAPGWTFISCFMDETNARALLTPVQILGGSQAMSVKHCNYICEVKGYTLSGVEFGHECWCDVRLNGEYHMKVDESQCNMACTGNDTQMCGGANRIAIYEYNSTFVVRAERTSPTSPALAARSVDIIPLYSDIGCYADSTTSRTLRTYTAISGDDEHTMTADVCIKACYEAGIPYAGVEYGQQCFCDSLLQTTVKAPESDCNMTCAGDPSQKCGGDLRINIYSYARTMASNTASLTATPASAASIFATSTSIAATSTPTTAIPTTRTLTPTFIAASVFSTSSTASICSKYYKVSMGEYCYDIWTHFGISQDQFASWNPSLLFPECQISIGQILCVQQGSVGSSVLTVTDLPASATPSTTVPTTAMAISGASTAATSTITPTAVTATSTSPASTSSCSVFYQVTKGEFCYDIWTRFGISQGQFISWNPSLVLPACQIFTGDVLCVQMGQSATTTLTTLPPTPVSTSSSNISSTTTMTATLLNTVTFVISMTSSTSSSRSVTTTTITGYSASTVTSWVTGTTSSMSNPISGY